MKKRATLYWIILGVWLLCLAVLTAGTVQICMRVQGMGAAKDAGAIILLTVNAVILGVLWLGSLKDLVFSVAYVSMQRRMRRRYREKIRPRDLPIRRRASFSSTAPATTSTRGRSPSASSSGTRISKR